MVAEVCPGYYRGVLLVDGAFLGIYLPEVYLKVGGGEHCVQRGGCLRLALQRGGRGIDLVAVAAVTAQ